LAGFLLPNGFYKLYRDYEYQRCGTCNIFMACELLSGKCYVKITETKTKKDWAVFKEISNLYPSARKIMLVMDTYNTQTRKLAKYSRNRIKCYTNTMLKSYNR